MDDLNVDLQDWKEMLLANNTSQTVQHYVRLVQNTERVSCTADCSELGGG